MSDQYSKSRQQAEAAFSNLQSQSSAKADLAEDENSEAKLREAKTLRLRAAREAKELQDRLAATPRR